MANFVQQFRYFPTRFLSSRFICCSYAFKSPVDGYFPVLEGDFLYSFCDRLCRNAVQAARRPTPVVQVSSGKRPGDIPCYRIKPLSSPVQARYTGPDAGLSGMHGADNAERKECKQCELDWDSALPCAYGMALSLYDASSTSSRTKHNGDPVADVFGVVAYCNGSILSVADGVNWGEKSRLSARCAVHESLRYLEDTMERAQTTQEVVAYILRSFDAAQKMIIKKEATMTTLCTACVCQVEDGRWGLCVVIVGDSLMFVYSPSTGRVREVTGASHASDGRDLREAGGALGPSDGYNPDLGNLTCSFTFLDPGDIVFGTTDGVSDNFDPVVTMQRGHGNERSGASAMPQVDRSEGVQARMAKILNDEMPSGRVDCAKDLVIALLGHTVNQTEGKRRCLEAANDARDNPGLERDFVQKSHSMPGKLDHAAVVAVEVFLHQRARVQQRREQEVALAEEIGTL